MSGWTAEPWVISEMLPDFIKDAAGERVADCRRDGKTDEGTIARATHIVACHNALAGLEPEAVPDLVAACEALRDEQRSYEEVRDFAINALAKARRGG